VIVSSGSADYEVGKPVANSKDYRLYFAQSGGRRFLLQIAADITGNGELDRTAYLLRQLSQVSEAINAAYAADKGEKKNLGYDLLFPTIVDSFICHDQGRRRINILAFRNVDDLSTLVPISNLVYKDRLCIDLRTSVWIMGRLLKLLGMVHGENIAVRNLGPNNILIQTDVKSKHTIFVFDWSSARIYSEDIPSRELRSDIANAAKAVLTALGGNWQTGNIPEANGETKTYTDYLLRLARGGETDAERAYWQFYEIAEGIWKREYYPFQVNPLPV